VQSIKTGITDSWPWVEPTGTQISALGSRCVPENGICSLPFAQALTRRVSALRPGCCTRHTMGIIIINRACKLKLYMGRQSWHALNAMPCSDLLADQCNYFIICPTFIKIYPFEIWLIAYEFNGMQTTTAIGLCTLRCNLAAARLLYHRGTQLLNMLRRASFAVAFVRRAHICSSPCDNNNARTHSAPI
jgi:hypothetical protein